MSNKLLINSLFSSPLLSALGLIIIIIDAAVVVASAVGRVAGHGQPRQQGQQGRAMSEAFAARSHGRVSTERF